MVFLTELTVDARRHENRIIFADTHALHRWIMRGFPNREAGGPGRVLYRSEAAKSKAVIIVQSETEPDWSGFLGEGVSVRGPKPWQITNNAASAFSKGQVLRFRLLANPIVSRAGKRHALLSEAEQVAWLRRKGSQNGFELVPARLSADWVDPFGEEEETAPSEVRVISRGLLTGKKVTGKTVAPISNFAVEFEGLIRVVDSELLIRGIKNGIGPAKGLGFGLLSVAKG